jgi:hypothetical protein
MTKDWTAREVWEAHDALETSAATLLGRLLFAFSRLDMNLGLCLVWADGGTNIVALTPKVSALTFHKKLEQLGRLVEAKFVAGSKERSDWALWIEQAHATRALRNQLTHGRWGIDPYAGEAMNVIGLPTSPDQHEMRYSLQALRDAVDEAQRLQVRLSELRAQCPV